MAKISSLVTAYVFVLAQAYGSPSWSTPSATLEQYLGQVVHRMKQKCLGIFVSHNYFIGPASCFDGGEDVEITKFTGTDAQARNTYWTKTIRSVTNHIKWEKDQPFFYNRATVKVGFEQHLSFSELKFLGARESLSTELLVLRLSQYGYAESRSFKPSNTTACFRVLQKKLGINYGIDEFEKSMFCTREEQAKLRDSLNATDSGAPAFLAQTVSGNAQVLAGIYNQPIDSDGYTYFFFTRVLNA